MKLINYVGKSQVTDGERRIRNNDKELSQLTVITLHVAIYVAFFINLACCIHYVAIYS